MAGISEEFNTLVGIYYSESNTFIIVMDELTKETRIGVSWALMFADDLALTEESELGVFEEWKVAMESKGLKVNMEKTKLMVAGKESRHGVQSGRWPCGCCGKESKFNTVYRM